MHATGTVSISESPLLQMGDGGNIEGLYQTYVDQPGACPYNATTAKSSVASYQVPYAPSSMSCDARCSGIQSRLCLDRLVAMLTASLRLAAHSLPTLAGLLQS